ncbi:hypothetical protein ET33_13320 [Paenibacillus tyrfis]|uniref:Uncharacterized protein n=1 Tax=Paenibacillus tyrfis TaxID=1501230 RepID=A0A081PAE1_9BACL|nr:hypothetical protein ET33_13320 [Paenibacillus tyrfis]
MAGRFDPILNPTGMIDRRTSEDAASIDRVQAMIDSGEIVPYWANQLFFSGSLPATRLAVMDFDPLFLTVCRAAIAGVLAGGLLFIFRQQRSVRNEILPLFLAALCVVVGFPLIGDVLCVTFAKRFASK